MIKFNKEKAIIDEYIENYDYSKKLSMFRISKDTNIGFPYIKSLGYESLIKDLNKKYFYPVKRVNDKLKLEQVKEEKLLIKSKKREKTSKISRYRKLMNRFLYYKENKDKILNYQNNKSREKREKINIEREAKIQEYIENSGCEWRDVVGYEGFYKVSSNGEIINLKLKHLVSRKEANNGYILITLNKNGVYQSIMAHRIVAMAFVPNPENKPKVNHLNGIRNDNRAENLDWKTHQETIQHSFKYLGRKSNLIGRMPGTKNKFNTTSKYVGVQWKKKNKTWNSMIGWKYKQYYLGCHATEFQAHKAYKEALSHIKKGDFENWITKKD